MCICMYMHVYVCMCMYMCLHLYLFLYARPARPEARIDRLERDLSLAGETQDIIIDDAMLSYSMIPYLSLSLSLSLSLYIYIYIHTYISCSMVYHITLHYIALSYYIILDQGRHESRLEHLAEELAASDALERLLHPVRIPRFRLPRFVPRVGLPRNLFVDR